MFSSVSSPQSTCDSPYTGADDHPELVVVRLHILHLQSIIKNTILAREGEIGVSLCLLTELL